MIWLVFFRIFLLPVDAGILALLTNVDNPFASAATICSKTFEM